MSRIIIRGDEARKKLKTGIDELANSVKVTLGPKGRNMILEKVKHIPSSTKDGVSVAKEIYLDDEVENLGAQAVKEVASKTADDAGDGTTTATILAQAIATHGLKNITAGSNPIELKKGIDLATKKMVNYIKLISKQIGEDNSEIEQIATVSSNQDKLIGSLIAKAMAIVGRDGVITIEESKSLETYVDHVQGVEIDRGYLSRFFINNVEKMKVELQDPFILITDGVISSFKPLMGILEKVAEQQRSLLVIAQYIEEEPLGMLVANKTRGGFKIAAIQAPRHSEIQKDMLEDIATITNGTVISEDIGLSLENAELSHLGEAESVTISSKKTTIIGGQGNPNSIQERATQVKTLLDGKEYPYEAEVLRKRLADLNDGAAVLYVGAYSDIELKEKMDRIDDALCATRAAIEEGIVPGGGVALIRAVEALKDINLENISEDAKIGIDIIRKSSEEPLRQIVENCGGIADSVVDKVKHSELSFGYNAKTEEFEDLIEAGVIDPAKVTRVALENAASIASLLLTTEGVIAIKSKQK